MEVSWIMPLVLLPGVALLVMSTSVRYGQIHEEMHHLVDEKEVVPRSYYNHLHLRAGLFRNAMVALYSSVSIFAISSIIGAITDLLWGQSEWFVIGLTFLGIICFLYAALSLVRESFLSCQVIHHHLEMIEIEK